MGLLNALHCWGMCGGIVAALQGMGAPGRPGLALAYNLGRLASYITLGGLAGGLFALGGSEAETRFLWLQGLGCLALVLAGLHLAGIPLPMGGAGRFAQAVWRLLGARTRHLLPLDSVPRALLAGAVWGLLPCGLVYAMLAVGAGTGSAHGGALAMLAFGLGTQPAMLAASLLAARMGALQLPSGWRRSVGLAVVLLALTWFGLQRLPGTGHAHHHPVVQGP